MRFTYFFLLLIDFTYSLIQLFILWVSEAIGTLLLMFLVPLSVPLVIICKIYFRIM